MPEFKFVPYEFVCSKLTYPQSGGARCSRINGDFKKLFTISEYYDKNRMNYYKAIQSVRGNDMDMTAWLEYFTNALAEQMQEIKAKGEVVIRSDVLAKRHKLSVRQEKALQHILQYGELTIKDFENICVDIPRRSLQRDLKELIDNQLVVSEGATNQLVYKLVPTSDVSLA